MGGAFPARTRAGCSAPSANPPNKPPAARPGSISVVTFARQTQNVSQGYFPDGDTNVVHSMTNWTPRAANTLASLSQPRILSLVQSDGTLALGCAAVPGRVYQLQFKDDLAMAFWTPIPQAFAERAGDGGVLMNAPLDVAAPHRFYRVVLLP